MDGFEGLDGIDVARAVLRDVLRRLDLERDDHRSALGHVIAALQALSFARDGHAQRALSSPLHGGHERA